MTNNSKNQSNVEPHKSKGNTCRVCNERIEIGAKKCIHCSSFQDWRRYLNLSSTMLALIVALISVLSISIPILKESFESENSYITILFQSASDEYLTFIGSNSGKYPGGIGNVSLTIQGEIYRSISISDWRFKEIVRLPPLSLDISEHERSGGQKISPFFLSGESTQLIVGEINRKELIEALYSETFIDAIHGFIDSNHNSRGGGMEEFLANPKILFQNDHERINTGLVILPPAKCIFVFQMINFNSTVDEREISLDCKVIFEYLNYDPSKSRID